MDLLIVGISEDFLILFQCDLYHLHSRVLKGCSSDLVPNTIPYWKVPVSRCFNFSPKCSQFRLSNYIIKTKFGFNLECWSIRNIICCCNSYSIQNVYVNISITKKQAVFNACILNLTVTLCVLLNAFIFTQSSWWIGSHYRIILVFLVKPWSHIFWDKIEILEPLYTVHKSSPNTSQCTWSKTQKKCKESLKKMEPSLYLPILHRMSVL